MNNLIEKNLYLLDPQSIVVLQHITCLEVIHY